VSDSPVSIQGTIVITGHGTAINVTSAPDQESSRVSDSGSIAACIRGATQRKSHSVAHPCFSDQLFFLLLCFVVIVRNEVRSHFDCSLAPTDAISARVYRAEATPVP
jgi:hypothetical protein